MEVDTTKILVTHVVEQLRDIEHGSFDCLINPHQRCEYSDSAFARIHYFYNAGSRNESEGVAHR